MTRCIRNLALFLALTAPLLAIPSGYAGEEAKQTEFNFPYIHVDRAKQEVRMEAEFSPGMTGMVGPLEFLLISGAQDPETKKWFWDRDYESVFVTKADPSMFHAALMLTGLIPGPLAKEAPEGYIKDNAERIEGDRNKNEEQAADATAPLVSITVEWEENDTTKSAPAEAFMYNRETKQPAEDIDWAFTGSYFVSSPEGRKTLAANMTQVAVAVFYDESAIMNLPFFAGNAHWRGDFGFEMNAKHLPPYFQKKKTIIEGTTPRDIQVADPHPVTLIFRPAQQAVATEANPE